MAVSHHDVGALLRKHGYNEIKKIGEGSFGKALLVEQRRGCEGDGAKLVCKMVDVSRASRKETDDAIKEGTLLSKMKHPYVVRYRESFIDGGCLCILMDYCEGGDLTKQIEYARRSGQGISEDQILRWMTQALLALKYLHEKHILHRDLKSGNFFLSRTGNLKMGDFGIAKVLSCTAACARTQIGTPYYLSPEVCQEKPYTWPSDIWAMGCILYELCALRVPFDAANISQLVQKICRGPTPPVPRQYSDFVRGLCSEMLSRSPQNRPSAESILQRPEMQLVVRQLLEEAQASREADNASASLGDRVQQAPSLEIRRSPRGSDPNSPLAQQSDPKYRKNDLVEYYSKTHKEWLPAKIINVDEEGRIVIDLKPNTWIPLGDQAKSVRPRRAPAQPAAPVSVQPAQRERGASPMRRENGCGSRVNTPGSRAGTPQRGVTPVANAPQYHGGPGSRAASPHLQRGGAAPSSAAIRQGPPGLPRREPSPLRPRMAAGVVGRAIVGGI